jgi:thiol-disulfide isomerase/thioredoxin
LATLQAEIGAANSMAQTLAAIRTESGACLLALTEASPVLLIFLRHFGCSFCRMTISQIGELQSELRARGVRPVFVHLGPPDIARAHFDFYGLGDVERIHDPAAAIYRDPAFGLGRVNPLWHLVNPVVWLGWLNGTVFKHGIGRIETDGHQMPGVFFLKGPKIVRKFLYRNISDQPKWLKLVG